MKSFDDLSQNEKEKLHLYLQARDISMRERNRGVNLAFGMLILCFVISILIAMIAFQIVHISIEMQGVYGLNNSTAERMLDAGFDIMEMIPIVFFAGFIVFILIWGLSEYMFERYKKIDYLIFGYTSLNEALEIKKSDISDVERTYKKKVKKDGNTD